VDGIDAWLFASGRAIGDTAVIDNDGSYVGTHIVYFTGYGEPYSVILSREDLEDTALSEWFEEVCADYTATEGMAYSEVGKIK